MVTPEETTCREVKHGNQWLLYMTGFLKTVSIICAKPPIFHFDLTTPKGRLQAM